MFKKQYPERYEALQVTLQQMRVQAGLTQVDLAKKLQTNQQFVSKYETGERSLDFIEVSLICEACGMTVADLQSSLKLTTQ